MGKHKDAIIRDETNSSIEISSDMEEEVKPTGMEIKEKPTAVETKDKTSTTPKNNWEEATTTERHRRH